MKHEIIIEPKDGQYCGKCTYYSKNLVEANMGLGTIHQWKCLLFKRVLNDGYSNRLDKPERCGECKLLCETFEKMPEISVPRKS